MKQVKETFINEIVINKSRFIAYITPLDNKLKSKDIVKEVMLKYPKATHYCYAYTLDGFNKSNDDGEPASTAGKPILDVLLKQNINRAMVVVVRYFGGIKLGAGGVTRAYSEATSEVCKVAEFFEEEIRDIYEVQVDYNLNGILKNYLENNDIDILNIDYQDQVIYQISQKDFNESKLIDFMQNKVNLTFLKKENVLIKLER